MLLSGEAERGGRSRERDVMGWRILVKKGGLVDVIARERWRAVPGKRFWVVVAYRACRETPK